jgi:chaperonin GroES
MSKQIKPLSDRVIIEQAEAQSKSGSFIIPESIQQKPSRGTIVAIGEDVEAKNTVKVGNEVTYFPQAGTNVEFEGKELLVMKYGDLIAII